MSLKDATHEIHKKAEQSKFSHLLINGRVTKEQYRSYLYQLLAIVGPIEFSTKLQGIFKAVQTDPRLPRIYQDYLELVDGPATDVWVEPTVKYMTYLFELINDPARKHLIKAHAYVRTMGDLSGGQLLSKTVPGAGRMFKFAGDPTAIKLSLYAELSDDLADEAIVAFTYFLDILNALYEQ